MESSKLKIIIREAAKVDLKAIKSLLGMSFLPYVDIEEHLLNFFVLENSENIIGTIGMEVYGDTALLRSLAIAKEHQHKGYGSKLCQNLISKAMKMNVDFIYLLTEKAEGFFSKEGFQRIARKNLPLTIQKTYEFNTLCPQSAICMVKILLHK